MYCISCIFGVEDNWLRGENNAHRQKKLHVEKAKASEPSCYELTVLTVAEHVLLAKLQKEMQRGRLVPSGLISSQQQ